MPALQGLHLRQVTGRQRVQVRRVAGLQSTNGSRVLRLQLSRPGLGESPLLALEGRLQLLHLGLVPGLQLRRHGQDLLLVLLL